MGIAYTSKKNNYEYDSGDIASPSTGAAVIIPENISSIAVTLEVTAGSGSIESTTNKKEDVQSDTDVVWTAWSDGTVSTTTQKQVSAAVTALRMINTTGTTRMMISCK